MGVPKSAQLTLGFANHAAVRRPPPLTLRELSVRAEALCGHSVADVARALNMPLPEDARRAKGFVGQLVEHALGADADAGDRPDFVLLGVELKTIPVDARGMPTESTFCCSIRMADADRQQWATSRLCRRLQHVLWLPVECAKRRPLPERRFGKARLWKPSPNDIAWLKQDWEHLMGLIGAGRSEELTAHEGRVLQVRPKAANADVRTLAPGEDGPAMTLPLGFYLRAGFTATVLS